MSSEADSPLSIDYIASLITPSLAAVIPLSLCLVSFPMAPFTCSLALKRSASIRLPWSESFPYLNMAGFVCQKLITDT